MRRDLGVRGHQEEPAVDMAGLVVPDDPGARLRGGAPGSVDRPGDVGFDPGGVPSQAGLHGRVTALRGADSLESALGLPQGQRGHLHRRRLQQLPPASCELPGSQEHVLRPERGLVEASAALGALCPKRAHQDKGTQETVKVTRPVTALCLNSYGPTSASDHTMLRTASSHAVRAA